MLILLIWIQKQGEIPVTKKKTSSRVTEHEKAVFNDDAQNDALAAHKQECDCDIPWEESKTIAIEPIWFRRKVREALEIRRLKTSPDDPNGVNQDKGKYVTTNTWSDLFNIINNGNHAWTPPNV